MRLQFHVLRYRFDRKRMISVKYQGFRKELIDFLETNGVLYESYFEKYEEEIISFECVSSSIFIQKYVELLIKYHKEFQHNFYILGVNGFNHTILVKENEAKII